MSSDGDSVFSQFLNTTDNSSSYTIVNATNPLEWVPFAKAFVSSLLAGVVLGIQYGLNGLVDGVTGLLEGGQQFFIEPVYRSNARRYLLWEEGLIPTVETGLWSVIDAAWSPLEGLGWLAYPVAVAEVLATLFIVVYALRYASEEVF